MSNTIKNFLVGVGFDVDDSSARKVDGAIDRVKSKALQAGAAIAGAFGVKALTKDFAAGYDTLGKFSEVFGVIPDDVAALGRALQHEGGSLASFMSQLEGIERMRAGLLQGDAGFIAQAGRAGIDTAAITSATNATEAYIALADQFSRMTQQGRLNAAQALGLDEASIRLLSQGEGVVRDMVAAEKEMRPVTEAMTRESKRFNDEWQDVMTNIGGFADQISMGVLPPLNDLVAGMNDWVDVNRELINQNIGSTMEFIAENMNALSAAGALLAGAGFLKVLGSMAKSIPLIGKGLQATAVGAARLTAVGAAGTAGYALGSEIKSRMTQEQSDAVGALVAHVLGSLGNQNAQEAFAADAGFNPWQDPATVTAPSYSGTIRRDMPPVKVELQLDGRVLDERIIDVNEQQDRDALADFTETGNGG